MIEGVLIDWQQVAAFFGAVGLLLSGVWFILRHVIDNRINPRLDQINRLLNGPLDDRIQSAVDAAVDDRVKPLEDKVDHINDELARNLTGYRRAS